MYILFLICCHDYRIFELTWKQIICCHSCLQKTLIHSFCKKKLENISKHEKLLSDYLGHRG